MKLKIILLLLFVANGIFAQLPQLRPEVVDLYRLQDIAKQSRTLNSDDIIEKHETFFAHPLFCEIAFGIEYVNLAEALLMRGEHQKAEIYFLKSAKLHYINTSNMFTNIFEKKESMWSDTSFVVPRTRENIRFRETMSKKILEIEKNRIIDPRIIAIAQELEEIAKKDQAVRRGNPKDREPSYSELLSIVFDSSHNRQMDELATELNEKNLGIREVDSMNVFRIIELIKENPDIDVLRIINGDKFAPIPIVLWHTLRLNARYARVAWSFFEPYWRTQAEKGKGLEYCRWYDVYVWHIKQDIPYYGVYNIGVIELYDEDVEKINERREKIGLLPLNTNR